jgi:hypothetical protein
MVPAAIRARRPVTIAAEHSLGLGTDASEAVIEELLNGATARCAEPRRRLYWDWKRFPADGGERIEVFFDEPVERRL